MKKNHNWTRDELLLAINLYCKTPFGKIHNRNPKIIQLAKIIGRTPNAVSYKLANFASIDPSLPRKGAEHVSKLDVKVWNEFYNSWENLSYESEKLFIKYLKLEPSNSNQIEYDIPRGKEKKYLSKARINQSFFRSTILASYRFKCCITNLAIPELLIASHIVPWAKDEQNRLNPCNGLCLNALHDKAFDSGLISLSDDFRILCSKKLISKCTSKIERDFFLKFEGCAINLPDRFIPSTELIDYHRKYIFQDNLA